MQIRLAIAAGLLLAVFAGGLFLGQKWGRANGASQAMAALKEQMAALRAESALARKQAEKLQQTLDKLPKSEGKVREIVRQNPSNCVRPAPVADGLQDAVREANRSRALPVGP